MATTVRDQSEEKARARKEQEREYRERVAKLFVDDHGRAYHIGERVSVRIITGDPANKQGFDSGKYNGLLVGKRLDEKGNPYAMVNIEKSSVLWSHSCPLERIGRTGLI